MKPCIYLLTCADKKEADRIGSVLLNKNLVACVKSSPITSQFLWKGEVNTSTEILLIMDSAEELFGQIEKEVQSIHSYETFVLTALPIVRTTEKTKTWLNECLEPQQLP